MCGLFNIFFLFNIFYYLQNLTRFVIQLLLLYTRVKSVEITFLLCELIAETKIMKVNSLHLFYAVHIRFLQTRIIQLLQNELDLGDFVNFLFEFYFFLTTQKKLLGL